MCLAISYIRFSRPEQLKGDSLRRQTEKFLTLSKKNGWTPATESVYQDLGKSGYYGKHHKGDFGRLLRAIEDGRTIKPGTVIVVEMIDRLSREQPLDAIAIISKILKAGCLIATTSPERIYDIQRANEIGGLLEIVVGTSLAHEESKNKGSRVAARWAEKLRQAKEHKTPMTYIVPLWLEVIGGPTEARKIKKILDRAALVVRMFELAASGLGGPRICKLFNAEGIPTWGRRKDSSKIWENSYIRKILRSRAVLGEYKGIPGYFPRVIEDDLWNRAQKAMNRRFRERGKQGAVAANLFSGMVFDSHDDSPMQINGHRAKNRPHYRYIVSSAAMRGKKGAKFASFLYDAFEAGILAHLSEIDPADFKLKSHQGKEKELADLLKEKAKVSNQIVRLQRKLEEADDIDSLVDVIRNLESKRKKSTAKIEELKQALSTPESSSWRECKNLVQLLSSASPEETPELRQSLRYRIQELISRIIVQVEPTGYRARQATCQILYRNGATREVVIHTDPYFNTSDTTGRTGYFWFGKELIRVLDGYLARGC
jgi:DNA invertase Pin-like site-specific DNA recombinase